MLLQRLLEYSRRPEVDKDLAPPGYDLVNVHWALDLMGGGTLILLEEEGPRARRGQRRAMPQTASKTSGIVALPFYGNGQYVLGQVRDPAKAKRAGEEHIAFLQLIEAYADLQIAEIEAVRGFYRDGGPARLRVPDDFKAADTIAFRVDGRFVSDIPAVQSRWQARLASEEMPTMQCLICGETRPVSRIIEGKIKGIPGGQSSGTALISANAEAFLSYGLESSLVSPTCGDCGNRFTKALNALLAAPESRVRLGDGSVVAFWTREDVPWSFATMFEDPASAEARAFLESIRAGRPHPVADPNRFYAVVLSAAGGRAVVREWIDVTLPEAERALDRWFRRQAVISVADGQPRHFSLRALAGATVRELRDIAPPTTRTLLRAALVGTPLPPDMLSAAVRRARADQAVTAAQASLIKLVLASRVGHEEEEDSMVQLQPEHPSAGYQCGRLLAVLEAVQRAALPGVKAGIVDRYFGSASSSPAQVFPRLVKGAQPHLGRLERDRPAWQVALQRQLEEVLGRIVTFPSILSLEDQGYFVLGYYHQRADDAARRRAAAERRRAGAASAADEDEADLADRLESTDQ